MWQQELEVLLVVHKDNLYFFSTFIPLSFIRDLVKPIRTWILENG